MPSTFSPGTIRILDATSSPISGSFESIGNGVTAKFTPDDGVRYELNSEVTVVVETGVADVAGNSLSNQVTQTVAVQMMQLPDLNLISTDFIVGGC